MNVTIFGGIAGRVITTEYELSWWVPTTNHTNPTKPDHGRFPLPIKPTRPSPIKLFWPGRFRSARAIGVGSFLDRGRSTLIGIDLASYTTILACQKYRVGVEKASDRTAIVY